jgi:ribosomal protein S18 acetylase RimI-like enzyme
MPTINQATLENLDSVSALFEQYRHFYNKAPDPQGTLTFIKQRLENHDSVIFLALYKGQPAGFVQLYPTFSSTSLQKMWILNDLFVAPAFRRLKIAQQLMNTAKQHAIDTGSHSLKLCTATDNTGAQTLYQQLGYKKISAFEHYSLLF